MVEVVFSYWRNMGLATDIVEVLAQQVRVYKWTGGCDELSFSTILAHKYGSWILKLTMVMCPKKKQHYHPEIGTSHEHDWCPWKLDDPQWSHFHAPDAPCWSKALSQLPWPTRQWPPARPLLRPRRPVPRVPRESLRFLMFTVPLFS